MQPKPFTLRVLNAVDGEATERRLLAGRGSWDERRGKLGGRSSCRAKTAQKFVISHWLKPAARTVFEHILSHLYTCSLIAAQLFAGQSFAEGDGQKA
jgi:hypothetical protein